MAAGRRRWPWVLVFLLLLLGAVIATFPAQLAWNWVLAERVRDIQLDGVSGSIWNGSVTDVRVRGHSLGPLRWQLEALSLLQAAPRLTVHLDGRQLNGSARLQVQRDTTLHLRQGRFTLDATWLAPALALPALVPQGRVLVHIDEVQIDPDGVPAAGRLQLDWHDAGFAGLAAAPIGEIQMQAQGSGRQWLGTVSSTPTSALRVEGGFQLRDRIYHADITVAARDATHPAVQLLPLIGQPQGDGSQRLLIDGQVLLGTGVPPP